MGFYATIRFSYFIFRIIIIKRENGAFGIELFLKLRFGPTVLFPQGKKLEKTRSEFLADFDKGEEREENVIASIAGSACDGDVFWQSKSPWIRESHMPEFLFDDNAATSCEIGMNERVCETFPQRLVNRRVIDAEKPFVEFEWRFDIRNQTARHTEIEVEQIAAEAHGERADAVAVARVVVQQFPIIDEIVRAFILNGVEIAEHQNGGQKRTHNTCFIPFGGSVAAQEFFIIRIER